ncbi:MAG: 2-oxo acid dehydrogenase subunit E2, partial [Chloroflexi bacterium]|nr:2-oxo acid dehydrogenase subunit E2 [Chloroflexota bacterium]
ARTVQWLKAEGDQISLGDEIAEIETDKAIIPMPSVGSGTLLKIVVPEGDTVPVGQLIAVLGKPGEDISASLAQAASTPAPTNLSATPTSEAKPAQAPPPSESDGVRASPLAKKLAAQKGVDISMVTGTGPGGRITESDVTAFADSDLNNTGAGAAGAPSNRPGTETVPLSRMRQAIAKLTSRSKGEIPHFYMSVDVSMDAATDLRAEVNPKLQPQGIRLSIHDMIVRACTLALGKYPTLNASFTGDALEYHSFINIGVVIDMEGQGIIVPAIMGCQNKTILELSLAGRDLASRAKGNNLKAEELTGSTFSISNLGSLGVTSFAAVIHPPNAAVLAIGTIRQEPVVRDDEIVVGRVMNITLSGDHRVEDGVIAAKFLAELKRLLEHPAELLPEEYR